MIFTIYKEGTSYEEPNLNIKLTPKPKFRSIRNKEIYVTCSPPIMVLLSFFWFIHYFYLTDSISRTKVSSESDQVVQ